MCLAAVALVAFSASHMSGQEPPKPGQEIEKRLREVVRQLPANSVLRRRIEAGDLGDGVALPFMDLLRHDEVRRAVVEVDFVWHRGLHNLNVTRLMYFAAYEGSESQITDSERLGQFADDGLEGELKQAALVCASRGAWLESPEHQHPPKKGWVRASTVVVLYDDPWLPVGPVMYQEEPSSWSSLEDASLMGDRVALRQLLAQRSLKRRDLDEGLFWAAREEDPLPMEWLLRAGAPATPHALFGAVWASQARNVRILLEAGVNPNSKDADGDTALSVALRNNDSEIVDLLRKAGATQ